MRRPLDAYPALRSKQVAEIEHILAAIYGARRFEPVGGTEGLDVHANHWQSEAVSLSFCHYGSRVNVDFPEASFYRQQFSLRGGAGLRIGTKECEIGENAYCIVPPDRRLLIKFRPDFEQLVLRIDKDRLEKKSAALMGTAQAPLTFDLSPRAGDAAMARLSRLVKHFISELDRQEGMSPIEIAEMEQAILVSFLQANPQTNRPGMNRDPISVGARRLRLVEEYIEAHWNKALSLEDLSGVAAVGARTIFHHFRHKRGKTPMQFIKEVRLRHAREMLLQAPERSITEIAISCGFGNLGHFAADYRRFWGERPSETRRN